MTPEEIFWQAQEGMPRHAPGSAETTRLLVRLAGPLPPAPRTVDIGCGIGSATLELARETGGAVVGVDTHEPFLAQLRVSAAEFGGRVTTLAAPMQEIPLPDGCADLVWAEGSAYIMGFDAAMAGWRRLLAPGGVLVLTEAEYTTPTPDPEVAAWWTAGYPGMRTADANVAAALAAGWTVRATYLLPDADWATYYEPLAARIARLRAEGIDPAALDELEVEITMRERHGRDYGYTGYVLRPRETR